MGKVVNLIAYRTDRVEELEDSETNRLWDELEQAAIDGWTWRDHESLDRLQTLVQTLRGFVERRHKSC